MKEGAEGKRKTNIKRSMLGLLTAMILKSVSESIYFERNKFIACKIEVGKKVAKSLMMFILLNITQPFQGLYRVQKIKNGYKRR